MSFNINAIRDQFPALKRPVIFFDNPGGTQVARSCLERVQNYLVESNANHGGNFATSRASDATVAAARAALAEFLNASRPEEIILGPNMTSLTFRISRALAPTFQPGDTLVVTHLDHDANISPWLRVAEDRGCKVRWVDINPADGTLNLDDFQAALQDKPRLVAFGYASNALGTLNPVYPMVEMAKQAGALVYIDAVQYAAHGPIDVQALGCDFLVCSAYKFFGPHVGVLYGRYELLDQIRAYRVRPAPADPPEKFETGTNNFEGIAGTLGAMEYFTWLGNNFGDEASHLYAGAYQGARLTYKKAMGAIRAYEADLSRSLLQMLKGIPGACVYGPSDPSKVEARVPTVSFTIEGHTPEQIANYLGERGIYVWNGNFYALAVTTRLGLEGRGGLLRVGATHYNTLDEVHRLGEALKKLKSPS
jgi:cysteine desulfurase family protein (TIGR01976 family)